MTVRRYQPTEYDEMPGPMVLADEYDALAQSMETERRSERVAAFVDALHVLQTCEGDIDLAEWQLSKRLEHLKVQSEGEIPDILDCLDYTAKTPQSEFVDEIGPLPQCRKCGLALTVCECPKPIYEPFNASGTMCPPSPEMVEEALRNRIEDDRQGVNSVMRKNAVLLRALALATQGDFQGYIDEAERILGMV